MAAVRTAHDIKAELAVASSQLAAARQNGRAEHMIKWAKKREDLLDEYADYLRKQKQCRKEPSK